VFVAVPVASCLLAAIAVAVGRAPVTPVVTPQALVLSLALVLAVYGGQSQQPWMLGPFTKPAQVNPVITPNPAVAWEALRHLQSRGRRERRQNVSSVSRRGCNGQTERLAGTRRGWG